MLTLMLPTVVSSWLDIFQVVDHSEKPSSVEVFDTLKSVRLAPTTIPRSKALKYFVLLIHPLNGTHTQSMSHLSQDLHILFNLSPPLHLHWLKWMKQVTSIRDHTQLSPGQSMSWKEQVFLMFWTLCFYAHERSILQVGYWGNYPPLRTMSNFWHKK